MKTSVKLNVSAQYFFTRLTDSRIYDIYEATNSWLSLDQLAGFSYRSQDGAGQDCRIKITKLRSPLSYHYQVETENEITTTVYELKKIAQDQVQVNFDQRVHSKDHLNELKNKLTGVLLDRIKANNLKKILKQLEVGY